MGIPLTVTSLEPEYGDRGLVHWKGGGYTGSTAPHLLRPVLQSSEDT